MIELLNELIVSFENVYQRCYCTGRIESDSVTEHRASVQLYTGHSCTIRTPYVMYFSFDLFRFRTAAPAARRVASPPVLSRCASRV
eukprot:4427669-Prymnesium_polylepis.1